MGKTTQFCHRCVMPTLSDKDWTCEYCEAVNYYEEED